eukprot:CAMPEP_0181340062 /NCGR_PEP_ID=MMETSP1101-20121128/29626_1 /TAXON_ID=46948 /ORGANISM="Rhodomonas abbreviata, Strain Caron Lab Isolate" /LENGTH=373 /DNA_ID=CAMNT_0023451147 /DNA_START=17 /DNA_END=1134 /DNA_ORIENTATION=-
MMNIRVVMLASYVVASCMAFNSGSFLGQGLRATSLRGSTRHCLGQKLGPVSSTSWVEAGGRKRQCPMLGLRMQLEEMPGEAKVEVDTSKMTEDMMLLLALQERKAMALPQGSKVIVFGALDRLGQLVVRYLAANDRYVPAIQTSQGYMDQMKVTVDGEEPGFPPSAKVAFEEIPADVSAAILCVEKATDVETLKGVLSLGLPLKKFVLLSKIGVDSRETDWTLKLNPFLKIDEWAALEEAVKERANLGGFDYTIVRVGDLVGGPFFDTNRNFEEALNDRIFDAETEGIVLQEGDQASGKVGRDVTAQLMVESLARPEAANKVLSLRSFKEFREDAVKCGEENMLGLSPANKGRIRQVFTPSQEQWTKAFDQIS